MDYDSMLVEMDAFRFKSIGTILLFDYISSKADRHYRIYSSVQQHKKGKTRQQPEFSMVSVIVFIILGCSLREVASCLGYQGCDA